jgi:small subunit ribosomal protein S17
MSAAEEGSGGGAPAKPEKGERSIVGIVKSDRMQKTRSVQVARLEKHPKYKKYVRRHTTYYVHDEKEASRVGDTVRIVETRPLSKLKRWRLVEVVSRSRYGSSAPLESVTGADEGGAT